MPLAVRSSTKKLNVVITALTSPIVFSCQTYFSHEMMFTTMGWRNCWCIERTWKI